jgi:hypothetical protein
MLGYTHWIWGWVDLRAGLDAVRKEKELLALPGIEPHLRGLSASSLVSIPK